MTEKKALRSGYTTGACAAAAAKGACMCLFDQDADAIEITLPGGRTASFIPEIMLRQNITAQCGVRKDAGDDPDVTHKALIKARVTLLKGGDIVIKGGPGVGKVTRPGLAVRPGQPAINPVPRQMIAEAVRSVLPSGAGAEIVISVVEGDIIARKTLNHRLGIIGGISILGTTGLVEPYSHDAYRQSITCCLSVAQAIGLDTVVLSTGRSSEKTAQKILKDLAPESFILMGDYFSFAVHEAVSRGMQNIIIVCYPGKLLKMAAGPESTHASRSQADLGMLADLARQAGADPAIFQAVRGANTVRHAFSLLDGPGRRTVSGRLARRAMDAAVNMAPSHFSCDMLVLSFDNEILFKSFFERSKQRF